MHLRGLVIRRIEALEGVYLAAGGLSLSRHRSKLLSHGHNFGVFKWELKLELWEFNGLGIHHVPFDLHAGSLMCFLRTSHFPHF